MTSPNAPYCPNQWENRHEEKEQVTPVSEDVKPPVVDPTPTPPVVKPEDVKTDVELIENARKAMLEERVKRKEAQTETSKLEERIAELESQDPNAEEDPDDKDKPVTDPRVDVIYAINKDAFARDNLDLIEDKMSDTGMKVDEAILAVKAELFDRIQKEVGTAPSNKLPKNERPTATEEEQQRVELAEDPKENLKKALKGELDIDPAQLAANSV